MAKALDTQRVTRAMIDFAVSRGIRDISNDLPRGIRKLADMGSRYGTGSVQQSLTNTFQSLLEKEDSPYYTMLENLLAHTDHEILKKFGINLGYGSWTSELRTLRAQAKKTGHPIPWCLFLHYDPSSFGGMTPLSINRLIKQAKAFGVNTFFLFQEGPLNSSDGIFDVIKEHDESAFILMLEQSEITAAQVSRLKNIGNTLLMINGDAPDALDTCLALSDVNMFFGVYFRYRRFSKKNASDYVSVLKAKRFGTNILVLIQEKGERASAYKYASKARLSHQFPFLLFDLYGDVKATATLIGEEAAPFYEFDKNGSLVTPDCPEIKLSSSGRPSFSSVLKAAGGR